LAVNNLGQREFARLIAAARVKTITIHGLRHTSATLLLSAGVPPTVVQQRLGHKRIEMTLGIYAHVLPGQQRDAATRLGSLLYGR
jgi:integrase